VLFGREGGDYMDGGAGVDRLYGEGGNDVLVGAGEGDELYGQDGDDELNGQDGADYLEGGAGADTLFGGSGNDLLIGGAGADRLFGGEGADLFIFTGLSENAADADRLFDFSRGQGDKIDLSRIDASVTADGVQQFKFIGTAAFTNQAGQLRYQVQDGAATVFADINGDSVADLTFVVNATDLTVNDFFGVVP
jgi:Ca2+-binding RTX toxin-like protein